MNPLLRHKALQNKIKNHPTLYILGGFLKSFIFFQKIKIFYPK